MLTSVTTLTAPATAGLLAVPPPGPRVCPTCRGPAAPGRPHCRGCATAPAPVADAVAFVTVALKHGACAQQLWRYKTSPPDRRAQELVAALLWRWLAVHERCLANACAVERFEVVTVVPSSLGRAGGHPLGVLLADVVACTAPRFVEPAAWARDPGLLQQRSVLVVDDTWTTGRHAREVAAATREAGASRVAVLAVGRHVDPGGREFPHYRSVLHPLDWGRCCLPSCRSAL